MSKVVVLAGSPRKRGNSNRMADAFCEAAAAKGIQVERFDTAKLAIGGCRACDACYKAGKPCVFEEGYNPIANAIEDADGIVLSFPVYWYSIPAQIKAVMDHWYGFCVAGKDFSGKKAALISCCGDTTLQTFDGVKFAFEQSMALMNAQVVGEVLVPGVNAAGDIDSTDGCARAAALADCFA